MQAFGDAKSSQNARPKHQEGEGGVAFVGGAMDDKIEGPVWKQYERYVADGGDAAYFTWDQHEALAQWVDANGPDVTVIGHSYGGDTAAEVIAAGHKVDKLITVDPVGWTQPDFSAVAGNAGTWINYNSNGSGFHYTNVIAAFGGAWNNAPAQYANHQNVKMNHVYICYVYCRP